MTQALEKCSFCARGQDVVKKLIAGHLVYICDICVDLCSKILEEENLKDLHNRSDKIDNNLTPKKIFNMLSEYVEGQEEAKRILSVVGFNHFNRYLNSSIPNNINKLAEKANILMIGPSGVGKTYLIKTLAKILKVPFVSVDATSITESGYVGDDVESILSRLLQAAKFNIKEAELGIVYIDEIDKLAKKSDGNSRDISGEGVQQGLLKIIEGSIVNVALNGKKNLQQETVQVNTENILFICGGAFVSLEKIIKNRLNQSHYGFTHKKLSFFTKNNKQNYFQSMMSEDLHKFGFINEFIGRLPIYSILNNLTIDNLVNILKNKKNSLIPQYISLFKFHNINLIFEEGFEKVIAEEALRHKSGSRALKSIMEKILCNFMFDLFSRDTKDNIDCVITIDYVKKIFYQDEEYESSQPMIKIPSMS